MKIEDVKRVFPDVPIKERPDGFQMLDRPCLPKVVVRKLNNEVEHIGCYFFKWKHEECA